MSHTVEITGISPSTSKAQLNDFFTIATIEYAEKSAKASIVFEKASAARTALMLNGGTLDGSTLSHDTHGDAEHPLDQTDKPRAGIAAEYLAKGYQLSDQILQRAIQIDHEKGISAKFLSYVHELDKTAGARALGPEQTVSSKVQATLQSAQQQARTLDEQKGISKTFYTYLSQALASPIGQKVRAFYTETSKQVQDIHEEARRIAEEHKQHAQGGSPPPATPAAGAEGAKPAVGGASV
ncbi:hypothetical protein FA13DRAFT_1757202 [Coprinellus micaceus]|uniref:RRM domain-containing protein n=1 Tax=Coprinellus micaceus TaxID=71717 RepID=A0A4Y7SM60_COPMI|nr:hypothetical protein FA13DRAFT_1757202 [Coprinellus micaceus]